MGFFDFDKDPDWICTNESDGQTFYGYDDGEGSTDWYDRNGTLDSSTDTPDEWECDDYLSKY